MNLFCRLFGHRRSRRRAFFNNNARRWQSVCSICRRSMVRDEKTGEWRVFP